MEARPRRPAAADPPQERAETKGVERIGKVAGAVIRDALPRQRRVHVRERMAAKTAERQKLAIEKPRIQEDSCRLRVRPQPGHLTFRGRGRTQTEEGNRRIEQLQARGIIGKTRIGKTLRNASGRDSRVRDSRVNSGRAPAARRARVVERLGGRTAGES